MVLLLSKPQLVEFYISYGSGPATSLVLGIPPVWGDISGFTGFDAGMSK